MTADQKPSPQEFVEKTVKRIQDLQERGVFHSPGDAQLPSAVDGKIPLESPSQSAFEKMDSLATHPKGNQLPMYCSWVTPIPDTDYLVPPSLREADPSAMVKKALKERDPINLFLAIQLGATIPSQLLKLDSSGLSIVHRAIDGNRHEWLQALFQAGVNINLPTLDGCSPLYIAAALGRKECLEILLKAGAEVGKPNHYGETPLFIAALNGHNACFEILIQVYAKQVAHLSSPTLQHQERRSKSLSILSSITRELNLPRLKAKDSCFNAPSKRGQLHRPFAPSSQRHVD